MAQCAVYRNRNEETRQEIPYLLDVQADLLEGLATRVVVPLVLSSVAGKPIQHLQPVFEVEGRTVVMSTAEMAGVPLGAIGERVGSLGDRRDEILAAIDFLFTGI